MNKFPILSLLIIALLFSSITWGTAERYDAPSPVSMNSSDVDTYESYKRVQYGRQTVYVPVTLICEQADGSIITSTVYPGVAEIIYKYYVCYSSETGHLTGGYFVLDECYPFLRPIGDIYLDVSVSQEKYPVRTTVKLMDGQYEFSIAGGTFTVTYNATVRYNAQGQIISTTPTTVTRSYSFTATGS